MKFARKLWHMFFSNPSRSSPIDYGGDVINF